MDAQAEYQERTATLAFRVAADRKFRVLAVAARNCELPSDWLRRVTDQALRQEGLLPTGDPAEKHRPQTAPSGLYSVQKQPFILTTGMVSGSGLAPLLEPGRTTRGGLMTLARA